VSAIEGRPAAGLDADFLLDPAIAHLNHGGFGACPRPVLESYQHWQRELERHPSAVLSHGFDDLMDEVRRRLAAFLGCSPADLALMPNTTAGLNAVARSLPLQPGDEVLATDHEYEAMDLLWEHGCRETGARYVRRSLLLPAVDASALVDDLFAAVTPATRVIFVSHITSKTAVILPVGEICRRARARGILTVIDGAHAVGQLPVQLDALGADVYAASCHKWMCAPRGTGFLHVRPEHQPGILAPLVSHGSGPRSTFQERHRWQGTRDPCGLLALPTAIDVLEHPEWLAAQERCHELARLAREALGQLFDLEPFTPDSDRWFRQMVAAALPPCDEPMVRHRLLSEHKVDAPAKSWTGGSLVRLSLQAYNTEADVARLVDALTVLFARTPARTPGP
jgi:isopenicillin-N epimerase